MFELVAMIQNDITAGQPEGGPDRMRMLVLVESCLTFVQPQCSGRLRLVCRTGHHFTHHSTILHQKSHRAVGPAWDGSRELDRKGKAGKDASREV